MKVRALRDVIGGSGENASKLFTKGEVFDLDDVHVAAAVAEGSVEKASEEQAEPEETAAPPEAFTTPTAT